MPNLSAADREYLSQELRLSLKDFNLSIDNSQLLLIRGDARTNGKECRLFAGGAREMLDGFGIESSRLAEIVPDKNGLVVYYNRSKAGMLDQIISQRYYGGVYPFQLIVTTTESKENALHTHNQLEELCLKELRISNFTNN
ncbi:TPA: hypothetical protein ACUB6L_005773 [Raoultella ornithinolytica]